MPPPRAPRVVSYERGKKAQRRLEDSRNNYGLHYCRNTVRVFVSAPKRGGRQSDESRLLSSPSKERRCALSTLDVEEVEEYAKSNCYAFYAAHLASSLLPTPNVRQEKGEDYCLVVYESVSVCC